MTLRIISAQQVRELLPMGECIEVMAQAMRGVSNRSVVLPPRLISPLIDESGFLGVMPGTSSDLGYYGAKVVSLHPSNPGAGLPAIQGFVVLFDHASGVPVALIEGAEVTAIRTAAASGFAAKLLAREDASTCGIFGTGVQAETHIEAMRTVRPLRRVLIWGRDISKAEGFAAAQARRTGLDVEAVEDPAEAGACDLVCTVTSSPEPILLGDWVQPGAHVNLVGAHTLATRESDTALIAKALLYVDLMESCRHEGGDFIIPVNEGAITLDAILGEIGDVASGKIKGRRGASDITVYNSLGIVAQDLYAARHVYNKAKQGDVGSCADL